MDFFFQNEQQKPPAQAAGTAATPPRPVLRPLKKPGTSVTSADEAESGGAKGAESTAGSKKGIVSRHSLKFETLHKEKAQEAAEAKSPSQKKADQEAAEARKKEAEALEAAAAKKKADDDKAAAEKKKANEKFAAQRAADDKAATRKKVLAEKAAAEKAAAETAAAEKRRAAAEALAEEKRVAAEKAAAEQLKATEKAYSFANLLIVLDEVANIPCKKKLQNVPDVHSVAELLEAIVERLKDDFERLGLPTDVNAKQSSSKHPAYSLQYFDRDFDEFVELDDLASLNTRKDRVMVTFASAISAAHSYAEATPMVVSADLKDSPGSSGDDSRRGGGGSGGYDDDDDTDDTEAEEGEAAGSSLEARIREKNHPGGFSERVPYDGSSATGKRGKKRGKRRGKAKSTQQRWALAKAAAKRNPVKRATPEDYTGYFDMSTFKSDLRRGIPFVKLSSKDGTKAHYRVLHSDSKCLKLNWRAPMRHSEKDHFNLCRGMPSFSKRKDATPIKDIIEIKGAETASGRFLIRVMFQHRNLDIQCYNETQYNEMYVGLTRLHTEVLERVPAGGAGGPSGPDERGTSGDALTATVDAGESETKMEDEYEASPTISATADEQAANSGLKGFWQALTGDKGRDDEEEATIDVNDVALAESDQSL
jgi:chemotaxis protein histidine kinase CheA